MGYERDIIYSAEQQEIFSRLVNARLRNNGWSRKDAAEAAGIAAEQMGVLSRTAPTGMPYGYFLKAMLALDIDLYDMCELLGLDKEVKERMAEEPEKYPNATRGFSKQERSPLDQLVETVPVEKQEKFRGLVETILKRL